MSFSGYSDAVVNVGSGFMGALADLSGSGGRAYSEGLLPLLPVCFIFIILGSVGTLFGFISYSTAIIYSFLILIGLILLLRVKIYVLKTVD